MSDALDDLIELLELEQLEVNLFRGVSPDEDRERALRRRRSLARR